MIGIVVTKPINASAGSKTGSRRGMRAIQFRMFDLRFRISDVRCWMSDVGCWMSVVNQKPETLYLRVIQFHGICLSCNIYRRTGDFYEQVAFFDAFLGKELVSYCFKSSGC